MKISDYAQPGDWLLFFPKKGAFMGNLITKVTFGKVNHAALYVGDGKIFETDGDFLKAKYTNSADYDGKHILIIRVAGLEGKQSELIAECDKYNGSPYSYWDLITNGAFFWLAAPIRKKVVGFLGTKKFMLCSELVSRITYDITKRKELNDFEGMTPEDLRDIALQYPEEYALRKNYNDQQ